MASSPFWAFYKVRRKMPKNKVCNLDPHEHEIGYAYPSSDHASRLHHSKTGCFTLKTCELELPFSSFQLAAKKAEELGTKPGRWSWDHPLNQGFYPHIFGSSRNTEQAFA